MPDHDAQTHDNADFGRFTRAWAASHDQVRLYVESVIWNHHDAEDVVQEIAYKAGRGYASYDPERPFGAWVMGIAKNEVRVYLRTRSRDRHAFDDGLLDMLADTTARTYRELSPRSAALRECMRQLPDPAKALLSMRYVDQTKAPKLAERLGMTTNAVHQRLKRVREALAQCIRKRLSREGIHG